MLYGLNWNEWTWIVWAQNGCKHGLMEWNDLIEWNIYGPPMNQMSWLDGNLMNQMYYLTI